MSHKELGVTCAGHKINFKWKDNVIMAHLSVKKDRKYNNMEKGNGYRGLFRHKMHTFIQTLKDPPPL